MESMRPHVLPKGLFYKIKIAHPSCQKTALIHESLRGATRMADKVQFGFDKIVYNC